VESAGPGTLTINPNGLLIDGVSGNLTVGANQGLLIYTDGFNYYTERGIGGSGGVSSLNSLTGALTITGTGITVAASGTTISLTGFASPLTTKGDLIYENATPAPARLAIGTTGQVLTVASGLPAWSTPTVYMTNPMTTSGDTIYGGSSGTPTRLAAGSSGQVLTISGGVPAWETPGSGSGPTFFSSAPYYLEDESTSAFATKGVVSTCLQAITVYRIIANVYGNSSDVYTAAILTMSSATAISGILATSNSFTFSATATGQVIFTFSSPPTLTAGNIYAFVIQITSGTGTTACQIDTSGVPTAFVCPGMTSTTSYARIASVSPSSGTMLTGTGPYFMSVVGAF